MEGNTKTKPVVVIGSGFSGAVAADQLVRAGVPVVMLERGPWRDTVPVRSMGIAARSPLPRGRRGLLRLVRTLRGRWLPGGRATLNRHGLFDIHLDRGLHVVCASGVGGGSHVYGGLNERPPDPDYWNGIAPGLGAADLEPSYQRVLARMGSRQPLADDQLPNMLGARLGANPAFVTDGVDGELTMGLAFPETPGQPRKVRTADGVERWEARPGEDGVLGSAGGGKTTLDFAFLARALQLGLKVLDLCEVSTIEHGADGTYTVHFVNHHSARREQRTARRVVVAAGTLNTLGLLLASVAAGGLAPGEAAQVEAALGLAPVMHARDHLLPGVTALAEADVPGEVVVEHLRDELAAGRRSNPGDARPDQAGLPGSPGCG